MLKNLFDFLGRLYRFFISLVVIAFLVLSAWFLWYLYEDERLQNVFLKEGNVVEVQVSDVDWKHRSFQDQWGNSNYLKFPYHQKTYTIRYVFDSTWISSGDRIRLLYNPQRDEFRQQHVERKPGRMVSRLIKWTSVAAFNKEHKLLLGFLVVVTSLFFFAGGVVVSITGWTFIQIIARFFLMIILGIAALFFTYDTWEYYHYYQHMKSNGQPMDVTVLDTNRHQIGRGNNHYSSFREYYYEATVRQKSEEWDIPITEDEYDTLKPNDKLRVLYDSSLNDFMSATYSGSFSQLIAPLFFWFLFLVVFWNVFSKPKKTAQ